MMELEQLRQLVAISEHGTMSAAAQELHISQPALSRSMQRLENALGVSLFDHVRSRTRINEVGLLSVELARAVLREVDAMPGRLRTYARSLTTIRIGSCAPAPSWFLMQELNNAYPDMLVEAEIADHETLLSGLKEDRLHIIVTEKPVEDIGILCRLHATETLYLSVPCEHPLADKDGVRVEDLSGLTMLTYSELGRWRRFIDKISGVNFIEQNDRSVLQKLVDASSIPCFITDMSRAFLGAPANRSQVPVIDEDAAVSFYLCVSERRRELLARLTPPGSGL